LIDPALPGHCTVRSANRLGIYAFGLAAVLAFLIWLRSPRVGVVPAWLIAITLVTFLAYWYDKNAAISKWLRVPERVLLWLTLAGGTLGAIAGMRTLHHKTLERDFAVKLSLVVTLQVIVVVAYYLLLR
jgi:uncharacterized membrane protein YsdA (DUF1294 family)